MPCTEVLKDRLFDYDFGFDKVARFMYHVSSVDLSIFVK